MSGDNKLYLQFKHIQYEWTMGQLDMVTKIGFHNHGLEEQKFSSQNKENVRLIYSHTHQATTQYKVFNSNHYTLKRKKTNGMCWADKNQNNYGTLNPQNGKNNYRKYGWLCVHKERRLEPKLRGKVSAQEK